MAGPLLSGLVFIAAGAPMAPAGQKTIPVPSLWKGEANVSIAGKAYRLPTVMEFKAPTAEERNPVRVMFAIGNQAQIGSCLIFSALEITTPLTLRTMTASYMNVRWTGAGFDATLVKTQSDIGAVANSFTGPNLSAAFAPENLKGMYTTLPMSTEMFYFLVGSTLSGHLEKDDLVGSVSGAGRSYTAIWTTPNATYGAGFRVSRVK